MGEKRNAYRALVGKPEGKRPLERLISSIGLLKLDVKCTVSTDISDKICRSSRNIFQFLDIYNILQLLSVKKNCVSPVTRAVAKHQLAWRAMDSS
jgi:hypothetical protein